MTHPNHQCARFGDFTLNLCTRELLNQRIRVKLQSQPLEVLAFLVERQGELVTREELRQRLWGADIYVDFDQGLNKAIKKIREALGDSADEPRYVQTLARRGYRFIAGVTWDGEPLLTTNTRPGNTREPEAVPAAASLRKHSWRLLTLVGGAAAAGLVVTWFLARHNSATRLDQAQEPTLTRITFDSGLQFGATFSPDGRFIAYSSDRGGKFDIWVQQVGGTEPHKVTARPGHNWQPDWSPDGRQIVFRSEGDGGGLFVVPAFGGPERKISSFGYRPRWSPDGTQVLFESAFVERLWSKLYLVKPDGEAAREILSEFLQKARIAQRSVGWYPDSKRISLWGDSQDGRAFWTVEIGGGHAVKSEITASVHRQLDQISDGAPAFRWSPRAASLYFEGESKGVRNIWKVRIDPKSLRWVSLERLTIGPGLDSDLAVSGNGEKLAFTGRTERVRIWSWPLDSKAARILGEGKPITSPGLDAWMPDISPDGKRLLFVTRRFEKWQLWESSLADGREILIADHGDIRAEPRWSPDGTRILCNHYSPDYPELLPEGGGNEELLVSKGFEATAMDWSPDGRFVLSASGPGEHEFQGLPTTSMLLLPISAAPHAEAQARLITSTRTDGFYQLRLSPTGKWIAFELVGGDALSAGGGASDAVLYVVPVAGGPWIRITDGKSWDDKPRWSADGKMLYFMSSRTGLLNVWATRFDGIAGRTAGEPFPVTAFDNPSLMMPPRDPSLLQISIAKNRLVLPLAAVSGNIWLLENVEQ